MGNTELIKELRALTQAGMKDCKESLEEAGWDLQKAVDIVKTKGLNIVSGREGKVASEGVAAVSRYSNGAAMVEVNCQTDFVANSPDFRKFATLVSDTLVVDVVTSEPFTVDHVEKERQAVVSTTKENVVVRRWWVEEVASPAAQVFTYVHSNNKIGVLLTLLAPSVDATRDSAFRALGEDLAMQVAAMNPVAVSVERLDPEAVARQKGIFEAQLTELNKPQAAWPKILDGKFNKWYTEVCLLNQESVVVPKTTIAQVVKNVGTKLGGEIQVVNFVRCQVGEGIEKKKENLADEVAKMM
jgi:elongation factor Ts